MPSFSRFEALIAELAALVGLPNLPADEPGAYRLTVDGAVALHLFSADDRDGILAARIGRVPHDAPSALLWRLLQANQMDAPEQPFQLALDRDGELMAWTRWPIVAGEASIVAELTMALADLVERWRKLLEEPEAEEVAEAPTAGLRLA